MTHLQGREETLYISTELINATDSLSVLLAAIEGSGGEMLNETDPLSDLDLLLLRELAGRAGHVGGRIEDLRDRAVGLLVNSGQY